MDATSKVCLVASDAKVGTVVSQSCKQPDIVGGGGTGAVTAKDLSSSSLMRNPSVALDEKTESEDMTNVLTLSDETLRESSASPVDSISDVVLKPAALPSSTEVTMVSSMPIRKQCSPTDLVSTVSPVRSRPSRLTSDPPTLYPSSSSSLRTATTNHTNNSHTNSTQSQTSRNDSRNNNNNTISTHGIGIHKRRQKSAHLTISHSSGAMISSSSAAAPPSTAFPSHHRSRGSRTPPPKRPKSAIVAAEVGQRGRVYQPSTTVTTTNTTVGNGSFGFQCEPGTESLYSSRSAQTSDAIHSFRTSVVADPTSASAVTASPNETTPTIMAGTLSSGTSMIGFPRLSSLSQPSTVSSSATLKTAPAPPPLSASRDRGNTSVTGGIRHIQQHNQQSHQAPPPQHTTTTTVDPIREANTARVYAVNFAHIYYRKLIEQPTQLERIYAKHACIDRVQPLEYIEQSCGEVFYGIHERMPTKKTNGLNTNGRGSQTSTNDYTTGSDVNSIPSSLTNNTNTTSSTSITSSSSSSTQATSASNLTRSPVIAVNIEYIDYQYTGQRSILVSVHGVMTMQPSAQTRPFQQVFVITHSAGCHWELVNDILRFTDDLQPNKTSVMSAARKVSVSSPPQHSHSQHQQQHPRQHHHPQRPLAGPIECSTSRTTSSAVPPPRGSGAPLPIADHPRRHHNHHHHHHHHPTQARHAPPPPPSHSHAHAHSAVHPHSQHHGRSNGAQHPPLKHQQQPPSPRQNGHHLPPSSQTNNTSSSSLTQRATGMGGDFNHSSHGHRQHPSFMGYHHPHHPNQHHHHHHHPPPSAAHGHPSTSIDSHHRTPRMRGGGHSSMASLPGASAAVTAHSTESDQQHMAGMLRTSNTMSGKMNGYRGPPSQNGMLLDRSRRSMSHMIGDSRGRGGRINSSGGPSSSVSNGNGSINTTMVAPMDLHHGMPNVSVTNDASSIVSSVGATSASSRRTLMNSPHESMMGPTSGGGNSSATATVSSTAAASVNVNGERCRPSLRATSAVMNGSSSSGSGGGRLTAAVRNGQGCNMINNNNMNSPAQSTRKPLSTYSSHNNIIENACFMNGLPPDMTDQDLSNLLMHELHRHFGGSEGSTEFVLNRVDLIRHKQIAFIYFGNAATFRSAMRLQTITCPKTGRILKIAKKKAMPRRGSNTGNGNMNGGPPYQQHPSAHRGPHSDLSAVSVPPPPKISDHHESITNHESTGVKGSNPSGTMGMIDDEGGRHGSASKGPASVSSAAVAPSAGVSGGMGSRKMRGSVGGVNGPQKQSNVVSASEPSQPAVQQRRGRPTRRL